MPRSKLSLAFGILTVTLLIAYFVIYVSEVHEALGLDPHSYACTQDSIMQQVCANPYGSTLLWSVFEVGILYWPLVVTWVIIGLVVLIRYIFTGRARHSSN